MILISIKLFWPKSEQCFNKINVLCLYNYTILKSVCPEQYIKRLMFDCLTILLTTAFDCLYLYASIKKVQK